jgi:hypothetical protein
LQLSVMPVAHQLGPVSSFMCISALGGAALCATVHCIGCNLGVDVFVQDLSLGSLDCNPADIYKPQVYTLDGLVGSLPEEGPSRQLADLAVGLLPQRTAHWLRTAQWQAEPMQLHAMVLAVFASIVSPFGARGAPRG